MIELPLLSRARAHGDSTAIREPDRSYSYRELIERSGRLASALLTDSDDLKEMRVGLLAPAGFDYVASQWAIWRAGGIKVPMSLAATESEWEYTLADSGAAMVMANAALAERISPLCRKLGVRLVEIDAAALPPPRTLPYVEPGRRAMILYTSGTTSKPKGVIATHANLQSQVESLVSAWRWTAADRIPLFLPLHHIHGIVNITLCALWAGAAIEPFPRFDLSAILNRVRSGGYTLFMAVPTIYVKLIEALETASEASRAAIREGFARMRVMVSGSAALPASVFERWLSLTGHRLLERYGMTETGMILSNPVEGERRPGTVGQPLPGVEVRLASEAGNEVLGEDEPGEIQVRGPGVFREYWNRPEATAAAFCQGWFRTGDMAVRERGYYRILGRLSSDIIKSGGYKLSALEIEAALLEHPRIGECAVIALPDETWGEAVAAAVVTRDGGPLDLDSLREWCRHRLSAYKIPRRMLVVRELPRNAMGKVTKPALRGLF